jgi:hypothetical protein
MIATILLLASVAPSFAYEADTVDVNQGVYICNSADKATVDKLAGITDLNTRRTTAAKIGCPFHISQPTDDYQAEEYPVATVKAEVCYKGNKDYCEEQAYAVEVYMGGKSKTVIGLWLDEDRD